MRATAPWLTSLFLHSLFLIGIISLSQAPPKLPEKLCLDFELAPPCAIEPEKVAAVPPPIQEIPAPVEPKPLPVKPIPVPPPVPVVKEIEPPPMIEPAPPQEVAAVEEPPPAKPVPVQPIESPVSDPDPSEIPEPITAAVVPVVDPLAAAKATEAAEAAQYLQTVTQIRGQVLGKLRYPSMARRMGWRGKLVLGFILCADGSIEGLEVIKSSGHKVLDRAAIVAVNANAPFSGVYARTEIRLPINFQLD